MLPLPGTVSGKIELEDSTIFNANRPMWCEKGVSAKTAISDKTKTAIMANRELAALGQLGVTLHERKRDARQAVRVVCSPQVCSHGIQCNTHQFKHIIIHQRFMALMLFLLLM